MQSLIKNLRPIYIEESKFPVWLSKLVPIEIWAVSIGPWVWCRGVLSTTTKRHECIHFHQQLELLFVGQWILYGLSYLYNRIIKRMDGPTAYRFNVFEVEAYTHESTVHYLRDRKTFAWVKYIKGNKEDEAQRF